MQDRPAAVHRATKPRRRRIRRIEVGSVALALGAIEPGIEAFVLTHGQFSLLDAVVYLSQQIGRCRLTVSTWTAGEQDLHHMANLLTSGEFSDVRWLVDRSFINRQPAYCARLRELFGDDVIRTSNVHAKFVTLRNESFDLAVRTSMNLNHNPRMENIEISDDADLADFIDAEFDRYFTVQAPGQFAEGLQEEPVTSPFGGSRVGGTRLFRPAAANG